MQEQIGLDGYKAYTNERMGEAKQGGGLAILVKEDIMQRKCNKNQLYLGPWRNNYS